MDLVNAKIFLFMMVLTRLSALMLILPIYGSKVVPMRVKMALIVLVSLFMCALLPVNIPETEMSILEITLILALEGIYGLAMGLVIVSLFYVVRFCGRIVERQMGFTMSNILDPMTGETAQPVGLIFEMAFIILFLSCNGHHLFFMALSKSFDVFPPGSIPEISVMTQSIILAGSALLTIGLRMAAPMLAAFLVLMVILAILARAVPQMNILFISMPLRVGCGLIMASVFVIVFAEYFEEFAELMHKLLPI